MNNGKTIVITGTSTGIGKASALYLDKLGYTVFAGIRKSSDGEALIKEASSRLKPILIDVTDQNSIDQAVVLIEKETQGTVFGLINNAGIGRGGALEVTPVEEIRKVMEVNVIGLMAVTKAFIPMLRKANGRIINIGSTSGYLPIPGASVYSASKFAVRAITDSLRLELKSFGISVILVSPGAIESAIWQKGKAYKEELRKNIDPKIAELYSTLRRFGDRLQDDINPIPAIKAAKVVAETMEANRPKRYYFVGRDARGAAKAARLPKGLLDWMIFKRIEKIGGK